MMTLEEFMSTDYSGELITRLISFLYDAGINDIFDAEAASTLKKHMPCSTGKGPVYSGLMTEIFAMLDICGADTNAPQIHSASLRKKREPFLEIMRALASVSKKNFSSQYYITQSEEPDNGSQSASYDWVYDIVESITGVKKGDLHNDDS